jgi:hypothetical protein
LTQVVEADKAFDTPVVRKVMCMDAEVARFETETGEARDAEQIPLLPTDGRLDHGDRFAIARAVTKVIQNLRNDEGLGGTGIYSKSQYARPFVAPPDRARYEDQFVFGGESVTVMG